MRTKRQKKESRQYLSFRRYVTNAPVSGGEWQLVLYDGSAALADNQWTAGTFTQDPEDPNFYTFSILLSGTGWGGAIEKDPGRYEAFLRIGQDPEAPIIPVGTVVLY